MPHYLRDVPPAGVLYVVHEALRRGFTPGDPDWVNLGQGQPETGPLPGAPERITTVELAPDDHGYGPVNGVPELRTAIAEHYNRLYRKGKSPYTAANVSVTPGGRLALNRVFTALGDLAIGYRDLDYSFYEDLIGAHLSRLSPVPAGVPFTPAALTELVDRAGIGAFLLSNPCNPTGSVLAGAHLADLVDRARAGGCALVVDEFYSQFVYDGGPVSAAAHVADVDADDVLIIDGLTKGFRYPGWRLGWVLGPRAAIEVLDRSGGGLDGGPSRVTQRAALAALDPSYADRETAATRAAFAGKRDLMVDGLRALGIRVDTPPAGAFYVWGDVADLPAPLNDADGFFEAALRQRVITVPGHLFDVDPGRRRRGGRRHTEFVRFSYGPSADVLAEGLARLGKLLG
ncbi:aminotransferase [Longispora fulva]|uniref:Aspartate/methionine/tyrosine aminotransferase n=1 Tax=Longispora fulva TaxID=619741 RepID=A0A8J7GQY3_9ACTN|nr:pyridoxal phosphate-dependent aminotransferase [Longispora fulva]MBG6141728.1 aspartate/methionine/tyrosine aminotransferase [Longispora fulva]GIG59117.1 aminotransferase [Longispora fulva]